MTIFHFCNILWPRAGLSWCEVSSSLAFYWALAGVLRRVTILSDDSKTYFQPWT